MKKRNPKTERNSELLSTSKVLQTLLANGKSPLSDGFLRWKIWRFWPDIVGPALGKISEPVGFDRGRLYVWVKSSARMQEMRFFEETLRKKVNEHVGRGWCKAVRFTLDRHKIPRTSEVSQEFRDFLAEGPKSEPESEL